MPKWYEVATTAALSPFLLTLARSRGWKRLHLISPWISSFQLRNVLSFDQMCKRLKDEEATAYVVTRPPIEGWHQRAVDQLAETQRCNIAFVPNLHSKILCADTTVHQFAQLGSANFTQRSLRSNIEVSILVHGRGHGRELVKRLVGEAVGIYRTPSRELVAQAEFRIPSRRH